MSCAVDRLRGIVRVKSCLGEHACSPAPGTIPKGATVSKYKVTLTIDIVVDINDENDKVDSRVAFQGDTPKTAINRAVWSILGQLTRDQKRAFGIGRTFIPAKDMHAVEVE